MPAEGLRDRGNEADLPGGPICKTVFPGCLAAFMRNLLQRPLCVNAPMDFGRRHHKATIPVAVCIERHEFDESHDDATLAREAGKCFHLIIINAPDEHSL